MNDSDQTTLAYIQSHITDHFWGFITLKFENGHIVHVRREENLKPQNLPSHSETNRRSTNESIPPQ